MSIRYAIQAADPGAHLFRVTVEVDAPDPQGQSFRLPAWIPGSYMIRDFARNIVRLRALSGDGRRLRVTKTDKHTWRCAAPPPGEPLHLAYEVYAYDLSVRAAHLDTTHGFFNGSSVFLLAVGREREACRVDIVPPPGRTHRHWKIATALRAARGTRPGEFGTYLALDYDELIDSPVEMGGFVALHFAVRGVPHEVAITGRVARLDGERLAADLARTCAVHAQLFEPRTRRPPFDRYTFLTMAVDDGYGGLEHRASTALLCRRDDLPHSGMQSATEAYRRFLGLASHEYFHAWNVKRIKPSAFVPYDLWRENYTPLLWLFEGFTSYYDDLALRRAGLLTAEQYLATLGQTITTVLQRSGRRKQSLAESSFDAWIKYYKQDENAPNSIVSYYQKGSLVAAGLDLLLRSKTAGRRSLDDVMRLLWRRCKDAGSRYAGVAEDEVAPAVREATGVDVARTLRAWTRESLDPDFDALLAPLGVRAERGPALDSPHFALLGCRLDGGADGRVAQVFDSGPAQAAGLSAGDHLVALDGVRASGQQAGGPRLDRLLARYAPGDRVELLAFRREELLRFDVRLARRPPEKWRLVADPKAGAAARRLRAGWLGSAEAYQSIGAQPAPARYRSTAEKCPQPMKGTGGRRAESGEGWLASRMSGASHAGRRAPAADAMRARLACACMPQRRNARGPGRAATASITASVSASHPRPAWLAGALSSTVSTVLSRSTPWRLQPARSPLARGARPRSRASSRKMLRRLGGRATPGGTENARPCA